MEERQNNAFLSIYEMLHGESVSVGFCDKRPDSLKNETNNKTASDEKSEDL